MCSWLDVNGPRGGLDKRCQIALRTDGAGEVVVFFGEGDWRTALDEACLRGTACAEGVAPRHCGAQRPPPAAGPAKVEAPPHQLYRQRHHSSPVLLKNMASGACVSKRQQPFRSMCMGSRHRRRRHAFGLHKAQRDEVADLAVLPGPGPRQGFVAVLDLGHVTALPGQGECGWCRRRRWWLHARQPDGDTSSTSPGQRGAS